MIKKIGEAAVFLGLPVTSLYHHLAENPVINVYFSSGSTLEHCADFFMAPSHYLFGARKIEGTEAENFKWSYRFEYETFFYPKMISSIAVLPFSYSLGMLLKGFALIDSDVQALHQNYLKWIKDGKTSPNLDYYHQIGIQIVDESKMELADCQNHKRRIDDVKNLGMEKKALEEITAIFRIHQIPFWIDCGTCLGAYRYGGVIPWDFDIDLSILKPDFFNAFKALQNLDPLLYEVQDWSGRDRPGSYLKVYVKKTHALIDIYVFDVDPVKKQVRYIIGNENSIFLPEGWKTRERLYTQPSDFNQVFPLKLAHFDGLLLPVPNQTKDYLMLRYGENIDPVKIFNPETNQYEKDLSHPYWQFQYAK